MPLDIGETVNYFADAILSSKTIHVLARNPIYTGLLTTFVIMIIILITFRSADDLLVLTIRACFWIFLSMLGILLIHNKILTQEISVNNRREEFDGLFSGAPAVHDPSFVPITPTYNQSNTQQPAQFQQVPNVSQFALPGIR